MQKSFGKYPIFIDIDTVNRKYGYYNVKGKKCFFLGILQIYYFNLKQRNN
jgi:hypothetical protein